MEMKLIGSEHLRICLSPFDMVHYDLTCETIDYENTETRRALWDMFDEAKHRTGFDAASGKISIKVYPEKSGGCEIYITKLNNNVSPPETDMKTAENEYAVPVLSYTVYGFPGLDALLSACKCLFLSGYTGDSKAYADTENTGMTKFYLLVSEKCPRPLGKLSYRADNSFICEFGKRIECDEPEAYFYEHCNEICSKNAVEILSKLC